MSSMYVTKRNGKVESVQFDKITERIQRLVKVDELKFINPIMIAQKVVASIYSGITTEELDLESAKICVNLCTSHHLYSLLASRILVSNLHKKTKNNFIEKENYIQEKLGILDTKWLQWINKYKKDINKMIDYNRDYNFDYFGFKTLERAYLMKVGNEIIERPQDVFMRVSSFINQGNLELTKKTYDYMSLGYYTHATPTLFNSGNKKSQLSSCFEANTLVNTLLGPKKIIDVEIGDEVVTHLGNIKKVIQKHKNEINNRILYRVKFNGKVIGNGINPNGFIVTEDHKLYTYNIISEITEWKEIKHLTNEDYIMVPLNSSKDQFKESIGTKTGYIPSILHHQIEREFNYDDLIYLNNNIYVKFLSKEVVTIDSNYVYTLGVEDDHSYSIEGIIAQNCFLVGTEDSMEGITKTWGDVSLISKWGGGIGLHVSNIRAKDTLIKGTNGPSSGIIPMLKVYNEIARYVDQCFIGSTIIYTHIGPQEIKNISPEMYVRTVGGEFNRIKRVYSDKYEGEMITLKFTGCEEITCTPLHPFLVIKNAGENKDIIINRLSNDYLSYDWVNANEIGINDYVLIPIPTLSINNPNYEEAECYMYGILLLHNIVDNNFIIETNNNEIINYIISFLKLKGINYTLSTNKLIFPICSKLLFTETQFTTYLSVINLPEYKIRWIIKGILADNHITISDNIIKLLRFLYLRCGELYDTSDNDNWFVFENIIFSKLESSKTNYYNGIVYDLEIENNHNYLTHAGLVHNGGKRKGSIAIYLEPHHPDILSFLDLKKNFGAETERARDLFLAVWLSDLFMKQVECDGDWYLMCPNLCPNLENVYAENYEKLYWSYVEQGKYKNKIKARDIMKSIMDSQLETGTPYIVYKDHVNKKSNQKNLGTIKSSNLCVHEDTNLLTNQGHIIIKELKDKNVTIWNGFEWSDVTIKQTGINQELISIYVKPYKNNKELPIRKIDCTFYHKFYVDNENNMMDAYDLQLGYKLLGYNASEQIIELMMSNYDYAVVIDIKNFGQKGNTYCLTEPKRHMAIFNGILTGQCAEILEYSDHKEYAVCNLASIAINKFIIPFINSIDVNREWKIYTKNNCKYCKWAKNYLKSLNINFSEEIVDGFKLREILNKKDDDKVTYPQIFNGEELIGGWDDLYNYCKGTFDYNKLYDVAYIATINLNNVIDLNYYPVPETKISNMKHRPIGLGIQGLGDALVLLKIPFDSDESIKFNEKIMETIYRASVTASINISKERCELMKEFRKKNIKCPEFYDINFEPNNKLYHILKPCKYELEMDLDDRCGSYSSFKGSPISEGLFQFDLWNKDPLNKDKWEILRDEVKKYGIRNSLLTALMPTASTSQIMGNNECFEFFTNNIYTRRTLAGDFPLVNKYLIDDLINIGIWNNEIKDMIIASNGSIMNFKEFPEQIKRLYQTIWEIKQKWVLENALARAPYIDQTQSMNIFMAIPDYQKLYSSHMWAWKNGLKTGIYYLRSKPAKEATKFTVDPNILKKINNLEENTCESCSA
jgi:ribonucleotide reductase alpha subunit